MINSIDRYFYAGQSINSNIISPLVYAHDNCVMFVKVTWYMQTRN